MRLLLDTHIAIWAALKPAALLKGEREAMERAGTQLVFSAVSVWEVRLKWNSFHASGERKGLVSPSVLMEFAAEVDWSVLPLTALHAAASLADKLDYSDPFDELLLLQAQEEGMRLLTRDKKLALHPLALGA